MDEVRAAAKRVAAFLTASTEAEVRTPTTRGTELIRTIHLHNPKTQKFDTYPLTAQDLSILVGFVEGVSQGKKIKTRAGSIEAKLDLIEELEARNEAQAPE